MMVMNASNPTNRLRIILLALALSVAFGKDNRVWQLCTVRSGRQMVRPAAGGNVYNRGGVPGAIAVFRQPRDKKLWLYFVDAGTQIFVVSSKKALDIDLDTDAAYARKGSDIWIRSIDGKERKTQMVQQMSREEAYGK